MPRIKSGVQTGLTLRCGWLSKQDQATPDQVRGRLFVNFLQPIADWKLRVVAIMSDKERGLVPAVAEVFPKARHAFCQMHYFKNAAAPVAQADEGMKVVLRKAVRGQVGKLIRQERATESPAVLTVTGLIPSALPTCSGDQTGQTPAPSVEPNRPDSPAQEREAIVQDLLRRVRYLLTLKGRPPFRLAGIEMFERLSEVATCLDHLIQHHADPRLVELRQGLGQALDLVCSDYTPLRQAADWLCQIKDLLDPTGKPARSGEEVRRACPGPRI